MKILSVNSIFIRAYLSFFVGLSLSSCSKKEEDKIVNVVKDTTVTIVAAVEPKIAPTMGFFLDDWQAKTFVAPSYTEETVPSNATNTITVDASDIITKIPLSIFGHNAVWWMGPVANETKFTEPITNLHPHIVRFPGGSSSDAYFWNQPEGVLPSDVPTKITNKDGVKSDPGFRQGKSNVNWQSNVDDYYSMLQKTNNKGIITVNYGYARYSTGANPVATAAHLAADWVRYDKGRTQYWEVGNENFGDWEWGYRIDTKLNKDNQPEYLTGELYAKHFQVFADSMLKAAKEVGKTIQIGAVVFDSAPQSWQTVCNRTWNETMMKNIKGKADFYVVHNYFTPYDQNSSASVVVSSAYSVTSEMMKFLNQNIKDFGAAEKPIALDEWNMWAKDSKQQVSNVSGLFSVIIQGEAIKNKYGMAARWDLMNGWENGNDHGLFSTGEPGVDKWTMRPSFYYMYYFQKTLGDRMVSSSVTGNQNIKAYGSTYTSGQAGVTLVNGSAAPQTVEVIVKNMRVGGRYYWYSLEGENDNGDFSRKVKINGSGTSNIAGGPTNYTSIKAKSAITTNGIRITIPAWGGVYVIIDKK